MTMIHPFDPQVKTRHTKVLVLEFGIRALKVCNRTYLSELPQ